MAGTKAGAAKAQATIKKKYGVNKEGKLSLMAEAGRLGGSKSRGGGFAHQGIGRDGLTGSERAAKAGQRGGQISKRVKKSK